MARPASQQPEAQRAESAAEPSRSRRPRRNRSASRAQGAANETSVEQRRDTPQAAVTVHEAKVPAATTAAAKPAAGEPIILGVGVPASEL